MQWFTGSCGGTSAGTGNSITVSPATTTTYFVRYSGLCNTTTCASITLTVSIPSTAATAAASNAVYNEICLGGNVTLTASGGSLGTGGNWVWYEGGCGTGASIGSGSIITITPLLTGTKQYFVRAEGACPPTSCQSVSVNAISANPLGTVAYSSSIADGCVGAPPAMFSVNAVPNCSYYRWTCNQPGVLFNGVPGPYETTVPNVNVSFSSLPTGGASGWSICVFGGNACRYTNTICTWVRAKLSLPAPIIGSIIGCPGTIGQAYSSATVTGAVSYQWSATGGMVITGNGTQSITIDFPSGFVTGTLSVYGVTACNYSGPTRTMTISRAPVIPGVLSGPSYPCPNASSVYSVPAVPGAVNYTWTTSVAGAIVTGTTNSCSILFPAAVPGGSTVSVTANSICPYSSPVRSKSIASGLAGVPNTINGLNIGMCGQTEVSYSISPVALAVGYSWSSTCGTFVGPTNLSAASIDWPANFGSCLLSVSATNNCGVGGARYLTITGAAAIPPGITGNSSPCAYAVESYSTSGTYGASSYIWTVPAGAIILGPINGPSIIVYWGTQSGTITVRSSNACGNSGLRSFPCVISCRQSQVTGSASGLNAQVYPNPATEKATVKFSATTAAQYHLNMTDVIGRNVLSTDGTASEGINMVDLDLNNLAKGVYMLNIISGDNNEQIRVVVE
ncbi:MAG: T9SS type A sorting domain-containing protein [Bacteroidetes bacterium]|nr:T9SS type A sorting domain-containing protein [Bacteroidota bacterium]